MGETITTATLRKRIKAIESEATVSGSPEEGWVVKTHHSITAVKALLASLKLDVMLHEVTGPGWNGLHVLHVMGEES